MEQDTAETGAAPTPLQASIANLRDWDIVNEQKHWRSVSYEERITPLPIPLPPAQPALVPQPIPPPLNSTVLVKSPPPAPEAVPPKQSQMPVTPSPPPNLASDHSHTPISICSFNTSLVSETERSIQPSNTRAERILDFCRTVHVVSLQEVWGPGVDVLTIGLSASHSIPAGLRSTNIPMITSTVNTLAFYFSRTGGLWVAHSKVGGWGDRRDDEGEILNSPSRAQPRYPPSKRPIPQLSLPSIPLTVPSLKALAPSPGSSSNSRNSIRALLLDMSEAWGAGRRLLLFNLQLDAHDSVKRRLQLREVSLYIQEVVFSLTSLIPLNHYGNNNTTTSPPNSDGSSQSSHYSNSFRHRRSSSTPHPSVKKFNPTASQYRGTEEFDMIDEYAAPPAPSSKLGSSLSGSPHSLLSQLGASATANLEASLFGGSAQPYLYGNANAALPPKLLPHLQTIAKDTAVIITGDFKINALSTEYSQLLGLLGAPENGGKVIDLFAGTNDSDTVAGDGRNRLVKAGSVLGRVDYMLNGVSLALQTGGMGLQFLEIEMVEGKVVRSEKGEEMSDHWPLWGLFRPK